MMLKPKALLTRLLLASALVLPLFLGLSAYLLDLAFEKSLLTSENEKLNSHVYLLLSTMEFRDDVLWMPDTLTEPRFGRVNSGLYAFIIGADNSLLWQSSSAVLLTTFPRPIGELNPGEPRFSEVRIEGDDYYQLDYDILWVTEDGDKHPYRIIVLHTQVPLQAELTVYRNQLWWLLGGLTLLLLMAQGLIVRWGLSPLGMLAKRLQDVERGHTLNLEGTFPTEIQPVTENLNRVLNTERMQRERYRNTLADLAHSLKTPLAVLRGSVMAGDPQSDVMYEQIDRMDQIIGRQLQRAVLGSQQQAGQPVIVEVTIHRLSEALQKVYVDKAMKLKINAQRDCKFYGNETDLLELLGNILDNAFKYGRRHIEVNVRLKGTDLVIVISDDGDGIAEKHRQQILQRGARADTVQPGYGIGLAVSADIISSYRGSLDILPSGMGGAEFVVTLPSVAR